MIAKIMSEVSQKVIGMLSADPNTMENRPSHPDFESLLESPEEQRHSDNDAAELSAVGNADLATGRSASPESSEHLPNILSKPISIVDKTGGLELDVRNRRSADRTNQLSDDSDVQRSPENLNVEIRSSIATLSQPLNPDGEPRTPLVASNTNLTSAVSVEGKQAQNSANEGSVSTPKTQPVPETVRNLVEDRLENRVFQPAKAAFNSNGPMEHIGRRPTENSDGFTGTNTQDNEEFVSKTREAAGKAEDLQKAVKHEQDKRVLPQQHAGGQDVSKAEKSGRIAKTLPDAPLPHAAVPVVENRPESKNSDTKTSIVTNEKIASLQGVEERAVQYDKAATTGEIARPAKHLAPAKNNAEQPEMESRTAVQSFSTNQPSAAAANVTLGFTNTQAAQAPVSFDWNAPQFSERLAKEIGGLSINGDSRKFEINPRNLGRMEIAFVSRGSTELVQIRTENEFAREAIVQHSPVIQELLKAQGRSDLTIRVDLKENAFSQFQSNSSNLEQQERGYTADERVSAPKISTELLGSEENSSATPTVDRGRYA